MRLVKRTITVSAPQRVAGKRRPRSVDSRSHSLIRVFHAPFAYAGSLLESPGKHWAALLSQLGIAVVMFVTGMILNQSQVVRLPWQTARPSSLSVAEQTLIQRAVPPDYQRSEMLCRATVSSIEYVSLADDSRMAERLLGGAWKIALTQAEFVRLDPACRVPEDKKTIVVYSLARPIVGERAKPIIAYADYSPSDDRLWGRLSSIPPRSELLGALK